MYNQLRNHYRDYLLKLISSTNVTDQMKLAELFIKIGDDIVSKNLPPNMDLKYYNDAAIHYTYSINISKNLSESQKDESIFWYLQHIIAESNLKLKELHSTILDHIGIVNEKLKIAKDSFSLDAISHKSYIYDLRKSIKTKLGEITNYAAADSAEYTKKSTALFEEIADYMKNYFRDLVDSSTHLVGDAPCKYAIIGLGSMSMRHMTPYSDLEFAILTEHDEYTKHNVSNYFKKLSHYINFKVICLGESTIANSIYGLNLDSFGKKGVNFDLGGKTSLGRSDKDYDLVCTVDQMFEYLKGDYKVSEEKRRDDKLEHVLENTCYIWGDKALLQDYQKKVSDYLSNSVCFERGIKILTGDIKEAQDIEDKKNLNVNSQARGDLGRFEFHPFQDTGKIFDVKQEIYRLPDRLIYNLGLIYGLTANENGLSDIDIIDKLLSKEIINTKAATYLKDTISYANILRLRTYDFYGKQEDIMHIKPDGLSLKPSFRISHDEIAEDGRFFRYQYTAIPLHKHLKNFCELLPKESSKEFSLVFEIAKRYFIDKSFYEPTAENKAQICLRLCMYDLQIKYELEYYESKKTQTLEQLASAIRLADAYAKIDNKFVADRFLSEARSLLPQVPKIYRDIYEAEINDNYINIHLNEASTEKLNMLATLCDQSIRTKEGKGLANIWRARFTKASILYMLDKKKAAAQEYQKLIALPGDKAIGETNKITALTNLAGILIEIGNAHDAKSYIDKALELALGRFHEESYDVAAVYYNNGWIHLNCGDYKKSIESFRKVMSYKDLTVTKKALTLKNLGNALSCDDQYDEAVSKIMESLELSSSIKCKNNLLQTYLRAINFYHKERDSRKEILYLKKISDFYRKEQDFGNTIQYLVNALEISKKIFGKRDASYREIARDIQSAEEEKLDRDCIKTFFNLSKKQSLNIKEDYIKVIKDAQKLLDIKKEKYGEDSKKVLDFLSYLHIQYKFLTEDLKSQNWAKQWVHLMNFGLKRPITNFTEIPEKEDRSIRIVSYNIAADFFDNKDQTVDQHHTWSFRSPYIQKLLGLLLPDIMCLQELSVKQAIEFANHFGASYQSVFLSQTPSDVEAGAIVYGNMVKNWDGKFIGTPLIATFVKKNMHIQEANRFWLNESPLEVPQNTDRGTTDKGFGNMNTYRAVLWVKLQDASSKKILFVFNSHYPLSGDNQTRLKCAKLEIEQIKKIAGSKNWISAGDRNLIKCDNDNSDFNPLTVYKTLVSDARDIRDHEPDHHYGISTTWLGFSYDKYRTEINPKSLADHSVLDIMVSNIVPKISFIHPGAFYSSVVEIIRLDHQESLNVAEEGSYFGSDHALLGADFPVKLLG